MYLVKRKLLLSAFFLALAAPVLLGIRTLLAARDLAGLSPEELKLWAESGFFLSLLAAALIVAVFGLTLRRSRDVLRELDKARELARYASFSSSASLRRLGRLGEKIRLLYKQLTEINDKKSLKISTMAGLIDFFLQAGDLPLLIADVTGRVTQVSRRYLEVYRLDRLDLAGKYLGEVFPDLGWPTLVAGLEKERRALKSGAAKDSPLFYPVFNRDGELAAVVCVRGRDTLLGELTRLGDETGRTVDRVRRFFKKQMSSAGPSRDTGKGQKRRSP